MDSDREELSVVGCRLSVREPCGSSNGQRTTDNGQQNLPPWQIVFPLHEGGGKLRDDTELRYALRALEAHFKEPFEVTIVGRKVPGWLRVESGERRAESGEKTGVRHIKAGGLKSSLVAAAAAYPDGFFWMYDDCCLLRDTTGRDMQVTPCKPVWSKAETPWGRQLRSIKTRLEKEGWAAARGFIRDYSCPHGPYWFDKGMVDEGFADWPGMAAKFPWESWILNKRGWPGREGVCVQYYAECRTVEPGDAFFLNYSDKGNTRELREWLGRRFAAGRFEREERAGCPPHGLGQDARATFIDTAGGLLRF